MKEYKYSEAGCLIYLCYFQNTSPSSISDLVCYWVRNNIMAGVNSIQLGINLQWISTPSCLQINCTIAAYYNKQNVSQVRNQKKWKV